MSKKEILFYYESRQNPNGDPGFENQPRLMPDETIMVTDVRIKRTMRDYAKTKHNQTLFVDYGEDGSAVKADQRAQEILGNLKGDVIGGLLEKTFDVPLFGALVPIRKKAEESDGSSEKLTGALQFGISRSVNQVSIINPTISGRFVGKEKAGEKQYSTFGKFYSVEYALIKVHGGLNPQNLGKYADNKSIMNRFTEKTNMIFDCMWNGTNELVTRSKFPQRSVLYIDVSYKDTIYNDLPNLVKENETLKGMAKDLGKSPFDFSILIDTLSKRKTSVDKVRVCGASEIEKDVDHLVSALKSKGISVEKLC
ncbi:type I CRISPR-associated protein Cas7 [Candidatus Nitrosotenuis uzonensis]|uniref:Putative CPISPR-associated protein Cas7 n=1 Tax=Candidatus Nitrosotenuis uzonensis TaxID=1407055 RepID=A0A812F1D2_9ARCH|nr:type I CRISPR-associated protein Cas7 [Candidatus Nitrosotenuis uzonensis]CAE6493565.1 putative CPISPR-associated protein Cas7 [Candidatus Nitrosotenuis uzonensis]